MTGNVCCILKHKDIINNMGRLPIPGEDKGVWGDILNEYLSESLDVDGTLKPGTVGADQIRDGSITAEKLAGEIQGAKGDTGDQGEPGQDGASITVTLVSAENWPAPADPDPLHWYVKVP